MTKEEVNILVVDDVNSMRVQIRELLKGFGFRRIILASNPMEAKQMLETEPIHLILCDWHMTPTDGLDLLKYVRIHDQQKKTAFVMVTAENTKEKVIAAIQSGVDDYLVKPLTVAQVQTKVCGVLTRKQVLTP